MPSVLENILTSSYKSEMISFMRSHPEVFDEAVRLAVSDNQPYAWRAAWLLYSCMKINDVRIRKYVKTIIKALPDKKDGHQAGLIKILLKMNIKEDYEGALYDSCLNIWVEINKIPSVRLYALRLILKLIKKYPELKNETAFIAQDYFLEPLSPGVKRCALKMIKDVIPHTRREIN